MVVLTATSRAGHGGERLSAASRFLHNVATLPALPQLHNASYVRRHACRGLFLRDSIQRRSVTSCEATGAYKRELVALAPASKGSRCARSVRGRTATLTRW